MKADKHNNKHNVHKQDGKNKIWFIAGISVVIILVGFLLLYSPIKKAVVGKVGEMGILPIDAIIGTPPVATVDTSPVTTVGTLPVTTVDPSPVTTVAERVSLMPSSMTVLSDTDFTVNVYAVVTSTNVESVQFSINFDNTKVNYLGFLEFNRIGTLGVTQLPPLTFTITPQSDTTLFGSGTLNLIQLRFHLKPVGADTGPYAGTTFTTVSITNSQFGVTIPGERAVDLVPVPATNSSIVLVLSDCGSHGTSNPSSDPAKRYHCDCQEGWDNSAGNPYASCSLLAPLECRNLVDDDGNGNLDCADDGCAPQFACYTLTDCNSGLTGRFKLPDTNTIICDGTAWMTCNAINAGRVIGSYYCGKDPAAPTDLTRGLWVPVNCQDDDNTPAVPGDDISYNTRSATNGVSFSSSPLRRVTVFDTCVGVQLNEMYCNGTYVKGRQVNCPSLADHCSGGACVPSSITCNALQIGCSGVCVNYQTDIANCGSCRNTCEHGQSCVAGSCVSPTTDTDSDGIFDTSDICPTFGVSGYVYTSGSDIGCLIGDSDRNNCVSDGEIAGAIDEFYAGTLDGGQIAAGIENFYRGCS